MQWLRRLLLMLVLAAGVGGLVLAFRPRPVPVEIATVVRGPFEQTIDDDGKTRVRERYMVSAPVAGTLLRIALKAGDPIAVGTLLAAIVPNPSPLLEPRTRDELQQRLGAAEARKLRAAAALERATAALDQAQTDLSRSRVLAQKGVAPTVKLERDEIAVRIAGRERDAARFEDHAVAHEVDLARAALQTGIGNTDPAATGGAWDIRSPVAGRVLRVAQESEAAIAIGAPLIEIGDPRDLEIVVDVLSTDAVKIAPGDAVHIEGWGGDRPLAGRVRRVEPAALTKVSALGVEEQRTNVLVDIVSPAADWANLGDGYRIDARIVIYRADGVVKVPAGALFRDGEGWAVFVDQDGVARKRPVALLRRGGLEAAVEKGLRPDERVVLYPDDAITDGARITIR